MNAKLSANLSARKAKEEILRRVAASVDEKLCRAEKHASSMKAVSFHDIMDIVLYFLSLQPDIGRVGAGIKFDELFKGGRFFSSAGVIYRCWEEKADKNFRFYKDAHPWANGPGPMDGTMGPAEHYRVIYPGLRGTIKEYFLWPEALARESVNNWPRYKRTIECHTFPKFRRKYNARKLAAILGFAEDVWQKLQTVGKS